MPRDNSTASLRYDLTGQRFGRLVALSYEAGKWTCQCDCGNITQAIGGNLRSGNTTSCGCFRAEILDGRLRRTHGMSYTPAFAVWKGMIQRCSDPNTVGWEHYGGRGITVCDSWKVFENFYRDMKEPPPGKSIDRIDNDAGYSPENCRWATRKEQNRNTRRNLQVEYSGQTKPLSQWCEEFGLNYKVTHQRINRDGWSIERALSTSTKVQVQTLIGRH